MWAPWEPAVPAGGTPHLAQGQHARWRARDAGDVYEGGDEGTAWGGVGVHLSSSSHNGNYGVRPRSSARQLRRHAPCDAGA